MNYANGDKYEGGWRDNQKNGKGTYVYANGDVYEGNWKNDLRSGEGTTLADRRHPDADQWRGLRRRLEKRQAGRER